MIAIYDLLDRPRQERAYKMVHPIPKARIVERELYILEKAKDKVVLDIGATGPMHEAILEIARVCYGIDVLERDEKNYFCIDLDKASALPEFIEKPEIIIAGEVIEHLSNAGHFLELLKQYDCPIVLTTPNAFSEIANHAVRRGIEEVNREHVCWYSYQTLSVLLERHKYKIKDFCWYNGKHTTPQLSEGLVCLIS